MGVVFPLTVRKHKSIFQLGISFLAKETQQANP
jgi:hypothetical protein